MSKLDKLLFFKRGKLVHDASKCDYCGLCAKRCPHKALAVDPVRRRWRKPLICMRCGRCLKECPNQALSIVSRPEKPR